MKLLLVKANMSDCEKILDMQIKSFESLLNKYKDYATNPGAENLERIETRMKQDLTDYYFIKQGDEKIGVIRIAKDKQDTCRIAPIFILPEYQGKGYAQQAILQVETMYPMIGNWELDTIKQEEKLCHLYEKMGYKTTGKEEVIQDDMTIAFYAK